MALQRPLHPPVPSSQQKTPLARFPSLRSKRLSTHAVSMNQTTDRPATPELAGGRSSFSSVRETGPAGLAQTFSQTRISSLIDEGAIIDDRSPPDSGHNSDGEDDGMFVAPLTRPASRLHGIWCPSVAGLRSWKQIDVRGRLASRSLEDLRFDPSTWDVLGGPVKNKEEAANKLDGDVGTSPIERLPAECLASIIELLVVELPPNGISTRNKDLMSLLLTSRTLYQSTLSILYNHVTIPHSRIFRKFLSTIHAFPALGAKVRRIDFSHFNPSSLFVTASERSRATNLTKDTLSQCLDLTPFLQEFLAQEHIDDDLAPEVLRRLLFGLSRLRALDFAGCSSVKFKHSFSTILLEPLPAELSIRRLSLHKCLTLPSSVFEALLPRLPHLTHLDAVNTRVTDQALRSIPRTARITHLNLAKCKLLSAAAVTDFVMHHPAGRELVFLSLGADSTSHELLDADAVSALLPVLPKTLRSLSIKGSRMAASHVPLLKPLVHHLEELAIGRHMHVKQLQPILRDRGHTLRYLDLTDLTDDELSTGKTFNDPSSLLNTGSLPLEVIELAEVPYKRLARFANSLGLSGWATKEIGSRSWLVRLPTAGHCSNGHRWWKLGAESWGMRKIPVAHAEVGGMYGSFMFGRKL